MKNIYLTFLLLAVITTGTFSQKPVDSDSSDDLDLGVTIGQISKQNIFISDDYYTWCASVIKGDDGKYHMFYSRWSHGKRETKTDSMNYIFDEFRGWQKYSEIAYAVSDHLTGPYHHVKTILKGNGDPARWDRFTRHNPEIRKFGNKYYLYYVSNAFNENYTLPGANAETLHWMKYNANQEIGVIEANSIKDLVNGKYKRIPQPIMAPDNVKTFEVTNNPSVVKGPDNKYYMMFKSHMPNAGHMTMWMATANTPTGPFKLVKEVFTQKEDACEDPTMWYDTKRKRFYAVLKNFAANGRLAKEFGALVLITSTDGLNWKGASHTLVSSKQMKDENGNIIPLQNLERPFIFLGKDSQPEALFAAARKIADKNEKNTNTFNIHFLLKK